MKIRNLYIDGYKNLIRTQIDFQSNDIPIAIIGNNGTGKSNLIEALIHIFISLYYDSDLNFSYRIKYECNTKVVSIDSTIEEETSSILITVDGNTISRVRFKNWIREIGRMSP